ncbi:MAG: NADH-quinone oxidoreductase subunit J [Gammaproteobacteria bacterium]|nr:NADH-quinone oxidoreductase subunit J [Gammaproteobacteria bacterium]
MEFAFYLSAGVAVAATLLVITNTRAVHALLYLVTSLLAISMCMFSLGAPFAGVLEIIVYAGAIMVLFVFVIMMLNLGTDSHLRERQWLSPRSWLGPSVLSGLLLAQLLYVLFAAESSGVVTGATVDAKAVGMALFGPYMLATELAAMLLLAAMVTAFHIGRHQAKEVA